MLPVLLGIFLRDDILVGKQAVLDGVARNDSLADLGAWSGAPLRIDLIGGDLCFGSHGMSLLI
jgi:hypothetical protein